MKKQLLLFICIAFSITVNAQRFGTVLYKQKQVPTTKEQQKKLDSIVKKNPMVKGFMDKMFTGLPNLEYTLLFNEKKSFFKINDNLESDADGFADRMAKTLGGGNSTHYLNIKTRQKLEKKEAFDDIYLINSKVDSLKWQVTKETKKIDKYLCYKAVLTTKQQTRRGKRNRIVEAWFTPQLPFQFGPLGFGGLPGLILEIKKGKVITYVSKITINSAPVDITEPKKGIKMTQQEFDKKSKEIISNLRNQRGNRTININ